MGAPQIIWFVLLGITLGHSFIKDGEPKTGKHNVVHDLIACGLSATLLWWGGFFG